MVCRRHDRAVGVLCESCSDQLSLAVMMDPQQLESTVAGSTSAALIDQWGYQHHLDPTMTIGRAAANGLVILEGSVSRKHAMLVYTERWVVHTLGASSGTYLNGSAVAGESDLHDGDRIGFGHVEFYFLRETPRMPPRPLPDVPTYPVGSTRQAEARAIGTRPTVPFELHAPIGGGGGFAVISDRPVQLTAPQYELVECLVHRMIDDKRPDDLRGFVPASALFKLSFESSDPSEDHIRQLVRRVRRLLEKAEVGDLIEVRRGHGYRLRVMPTLARPSSSS